MSVPDISGNGQNIQRFMKFLQIAAAVFAATSLLSVDASAAKMAFTLADKNMSRATFGTQKMETYNVAVRLNDPTFVGCKVVGVRVPLPQTSNINGTKAFLTKELAKGVPGDTKANNPDICEIEASYAGGYLEATFAEPYVITDEPFYAGYTFTVTGQDAYANSPVVGTTQSNADGFYLMTSRTYLKWKAYSESRNFTSALEVILEGDFASNSVSASYTHVLPLSAGKVINLPVTLTNHGSEQIKNVGYSYKLTSKADGKVVEGKGVTTFNPVLDLTFGATANVELEIDATETTVGAWVIDLTLDQVNGQDNPDTAKSFTAEEELLEYVPQKRVLMEEYTGFWCGNCPRGFAAMEHLKKKYPYNFIAMAYHEGDQLQHVPNASFPNAANSFPGCYLDRSTDLIDPYAGSTRSGFGIENDLIKLMNSFAPVDVTVKASMDENGVIDVTCNTNFVNRIDGQPRVAYYLVANRLREKVADGAEPTWLQHNYFSGNSTASWAIPEMEQFCNGPSIMGDLEWNDIIVMYSNVLGEPSSIPADYELNAWNESKFEFNTNNCRSVPNRYSAGNQNYILNHDWLNVVAVVVDARTNTVINSAECRVTTSGVGEISDATEATVVDTVWYNLGGSRVDNPTDGIFIKVTVFSDGRRVSEKVALGK